MKKKQKKNIILTLFISLCTIFLLFVFVVLLNANITYYYLNLPIENTIDVIYEKDETFEVKAIYKLNILDKEIEIKANYDDQINHLKLGNDNVVTITSKYLFNESEKDIVVNLIDDQYPTIELISDNNYVLQTNEQYIEEGFQASDNYDGDLTDKVVVSKVVDGKITYSVTDSYGNTTSVVRQLKYNSDKGPSISVKCDYLTIEKGKSFNIPSYYAYDEADGDLTDKVVVKNNVDVNTVGQYYISFTVTDSKGNSRVVKKQVYVYEKQASDINEKDVSNKIIYLTFDDGPSKYTSKLLETLDKYNVKVTFFVTGSGSSYRSSIVSAYNKGHSIGLHTFSHVYSNIYASSDAFWNDLAKVDSMVYNLTAFHPTIFRFAGGASNTVSKAYCKGVMSLLAKQSKEKGYRYYDWNVSSGDAGGTSKTSVVFENVKKGCSKKNISVVLQHDIKGYSVDAVDRIIGWGIANGYTFLPITDATTYTCHHSIAN